MGLGNEMKKIFEELLGPDVAKQLDNFDDPEKYPEDFIEECTHFMAELIGAESAEEKLGALSKKYLKVNKSGGSSCAKVATGKLKLFYTMRNLSDHFTVHKL